MLTNRDSRWDPDCDGPALGPPLEWERRVFVVALIYAVPGMLLGGLAAVILAVVAGTPPAAPMILGTLAGMVGGGLLEGSDG